MCRNQRPCVCMLHSIHWNPFNRLCAFVCLTMMVITKEKQLKFLKYFICSGLNCVHQTRWVYNPFFFLYQYCYRKLIIHCLSEWIYSLGRLQITSSQTSYKMEVTDCNRATHAFFFTGKTSRRNVCQANRSRF